MSEDETAAFVREIDTALLGWMTVHGITPLSMSAIMLARLRFINMVGHGVEGLNEYYDLLEYHIEDVYRQAETLMDLEDIHNEWLANDNKKSADILQFRKKDDTTE